MAVVLRTLEAPQGPLAWFPLGLCTKPKMSCICLTLVRSLAWKQLERDRCPPPPLSLPMSGLSGIPALARRPTAGPV